MNLETRELLTIVMGREEAREVMVFLDGFQTGLPSGAKELHNLLLAHFDERVGF